VTPVEHADDDLLADVASLTETDRARFDAGLERNRLLVHVTMKQRHARLDSDRLGGGGIDLGGAGVDQRASELGPTDAFHVQVESGLTQAGRSRDDHRTANPAFAAVCPWQLRRGRPRNPEIAVLGERVECLDGDAEYARDE